MQPTGISRVIQSSYDENDDAFNWMGKDDKDGWGIFGTFVVEEIQKLNPHNQLLAKRYITNFLFDCQMSEIGKNGMEGDSSTNQPQEFRYFDAQLYPFPGSSVNTFQSDNSCFAYSSSNEYSVHTDVPPISYESCYKDEILHQYRDFFSNKKSQ